MVFIHVYIYTSDKDGEDLGMVFRINFTSLRTYPSPSRYAKASAASGTSLDLRPRPGSFDVNDMLWLQKSLFNELPHHSESKANP